MKISPRGIGLVVTTLAAVGCGGATSDGLPREPISGEVTLDGRPLEAGEITFVPDGFEGLPIGAQVEDGRFSVPREDGPIPGNYRVSVYSSKPTGKTYPDPGDPTMTIEETYETIPPQYNLNSKMNADVQEGGDNSFTFEISGEIKTPPPARRR